MGETRLPVIAILGGTGKEGTGLALRWAKNGYPVIIGSRQKEKAQLVVDQLKKELPGGNFRPLVNDEAANAADINVLTVVQDAHQTALQSLRSVLSGKILVDATARVDFRNPQPPSPPSAGRIAQEILGPKVKVVAAFQNVPAYNLKKNLERKLDFDVLVFSDDTIAADTVIELVKGADMRGYYAGNLDNAIVLEGLVAVLISLNKHYKIKTASVKLTGVPEV